MRDIFFVIWFLGLAITCHAENCIIAELSNQFGNSTVTTRGLFSSGFEHSAFRPCDSTHDKRWWLSTSNSSLWEALHSPSGTSEKKWPPSPEIYIEVEGCLSPIGHYGHMGAYERHIVVSKVLNVKKVAPQDCTTASSP